MLGGGSGSGPNRSATFFCRSRRGLSRSASLWSRRGLGCWPGWSGWPSHWRSHIDGEGGCCRLLWIVLVVSGDKPSKVLDRQCRFPGILLLRVAFPRDQIVEPWQLTCCWLFGIDRAVPNAINLILLVVVASLELEIQLRIIHSPLLCGILFQQGYVKDVVNPPFFGQFKLVSLFAYRV